MIVNRRDILYQANSIAYLEFDLKLNQLRILTAIIKNLQKELKERFDMLGKYRRKDLPPISAKITVPVADFHFGKNNSGRLRHCLDETGSTFFSSYEYPPYATKVTLNLKDSFLNLLSKEEGYHRYSFALATSIKNKYTLRLYWLISVWRVRGGFVLQEDALKRILGLSKAYDKFSNIIGRVLEPARLDLKSRFPIWFEYQVTAREGEHCIIFQVRVRITDEERSHLLTESREVISHLLNSVGIRPSALHSPNYPSWSLRTSAFSSISCRTLSYSSASTRKSETAPPTFAPLAVPGSQTGWSATAPSLLFSSRTLPRVFDILHIHFMNLRARVALQND